MGQWRITIKTVLFKDYLSQHSIIPIFHYSRVMALPYAPCSMLHALYPMPYALCFMLTSHLYDKKRRDYQGYKCRFHRRR